MKTDDLKKIFGKGLVESYEAKIGQIIPLTADERKTILTALSKAAQTPEFWEHPCLESDLGDAGKQKIMLLRAPGNVQEKAKDFTTGINLSMLFTGNQGDQWIGAIFPAGTEKLISPNEVYFVCGRYSEKAGDRGTFHNLAVTGVFGEDDLTPAGELSKFE